MQLGTVTDKLNLYADKKTNKTGDYKVNYNPPPRQKVKNLYRAIK